MSVLNNSVLVLNRSWAAVNVATAARALTLLWNEAARVVDPDTYQLFTWDDWSDLAPKDGESFIQSIRQRIRVPEVIVLSNYDRLPTNIVTFSRRNVFKRDKYTCQYCGKQPKGEDLTLDHIVPRSAGGTSTWENVVLACVDCNTKKADLPLRASGLKLRNSPTKPSWKPLYSNPQVRVASWSKFVSDVYWTIKLDP